MSPGAPARPGGWVYRNSRWYYLPGGAEWFDASPVHVDRDALANLVDPAELTRQVDALVRICNLPVVVLFSHEGRDEKLEPCLPAWFRGEKVEGSFVNALAEAARAACAAGTPAAADSILGRSTAVGFPIGFRFQERRIVHGATAMLVAGSDALGTSSDLPLPAYEMLASQLPTLAVARDAAGLLSLLTTAYSDRVFETLTHRTEVATQQTSARHHMIRAESMERRVFQDSQNGERKAADSSEPIGPELESILEIPDLAITVEDLNYLVRYANPAMKDHFGSVVGRKCYEALKGRSSPCFPCVLKRIWEEGETYVHYNASDPRTGKHYEIMSMPVVSRRGDKLVLEVGVEVTRPVRLAKRLQDQVATLKERVAEMSRLFDSLAAKLAPDLRSVVPPGLVDAEAVVKQEVQRMAGELRRDFSLSVSVIPLFATSPDLFARLVHELLAELVSTAPQSPVDVRIWHTMSGNASALTPGDRYHVLAFTTAGSTAPAGTAAAKAPAVPPIPGEATSADAAAPAEAVGGQTLPLLASRLREAVEGQTLPLLALRLSATVWESPQESGVLTVYVSFPDKLPEE